MGRLMLARPPARPPLRADRMIELAELVTPCCSEGLLVVAMAGEVMSVFVRRYVARTIVAVAVCALSTPLFSAPSCCGDGMEFKCLFRWGDSWKAEVPETSKVRKSLMMILVMVRIVRGFLNSKTT